MPLLHERTRLVPVRAVHAAVTGLRREQRLTTRALPEKHVAARGHRFDGLMSTRGTCNRGSHRHRRRHADRILARVVTRRTADVSIERTFYAASVVHKRIKFWPSRSPVDGLLDRLYARNVAQKDAWHSAPFSLGCFWWFCGRTPKSCSTTTHQTSEPNEDR